MVLTVEEDTSPARGAPPNAGVVELDVMLSGYRFVVLALGSRTDSRRSAPDLRERADAMYVYGLVIANKQADPDHAISSVLARHGADTDYTFEEAAAWYFGLAVALVEADLPPSG